MKGEERGEQSAKKQKNQLDSNVRSFANFYQSFNKQLRANK